MDPTVPHGAAILLDFIRKTEVGTESRAGYDVIYGFNQDELDRPVTAMTVDEVQAQQRSWFKRFGSSATGAYQFMQETLGDLKRELGLSGTQVMDPNLQDRLAYHLLKRRGYEQYVSGLINRTKFGKRLAMEWASLPVLAATRGAHRSLSRGQSYYAGDRLNKALVEPETVEAVLDEALVAARVPDLADVPIPTPKPEEAPMPEKPKKELTPPEQMNKPIAGIKGGALTASIGGAVLVLLNGSGWLPDGWQSAEAQGALTVLFTTLPALIVGFWRGYQAPDLRYTQD